MRNMASFVGLEVIVPMVYHITEKIKKTKNDFVYEILLNSL